MENKDRIKYKYNYDDIVRMYETKEITLDQIIKLAGLHNRNGIDPISLSRLTRTGPLQYNRDGVIAEPFVFSFEFPLSDDDEIFPKKKEE